MHEYVRNTYKITQKFPREELYSSVSQIRRAALSVVLNYIEGYCRRRKLVQLNMYEISYGSLGESRYVYHLAFDLGWISREELDIAVTLAEEIGAMLWSELESVESWIEKNKGQ